MTPQKQPGSVILPVSAAIPELQQSKTAALNALASKHSQRSYEYAIAGFIAWYCSEPQLTFRGSVVVKYRSFLEHLSLSAVTSNLWKSSLLCIQKNYCEFMMFPTMDCDPRCV